VVYSLSFWVVVPLDESTCIEFVESLTALWEVMMVLNNLEVI